MLIFYCAFTVLFTAGANGNSTFEPVWYRILSLALAPVLVPIYLGVAVRKLLTK